MVPRDQGQDRLLADEEDQGLDDRAQLNAQGLGGVLGGARLFLKLDDAALQGRADLVSPARLFDKFVDFFVVAFFFVVANFFGVAFFFGAAFFFAVLVVLFMAFSSFRYRHAAGYRRPFPDGPEPPLHVGVLGDLHPVIGVAGGPGIGGDIGDGVALPR